MQGAQVAAFRAELHDPPGGGSLGMVAGVSRVSHGYQVWRSELLVDEDRKEVGVLYLSGKSVREIARQMKIPKTTVHRWIRKDFPDSVEADKR